MNEEKKLKKCQFCAEEILEEAIKCKHCGSDLVKEKRKEGKNQKGSSVKKLRKIAIILYFLELLFGVVMTTAIIIKMGIMPDLQKGVLLPTTLWLIINLLTDNKKKIETIIPWYKNKWGWLIVYITIVLPFLFLSFINAIGLLLE